MIYPKNLNKNDYIGVIATSKGISKDTEILKFEKAKENFKSYGHNIIESSNIMKNDKARSSSGKERAEEFLKLWTNKDVKAIITLKGGQFLIEMLPFLNEHKDILKNSQPKWIQGFSDTTVLSYYLTTNFDIATIHADNFMNYGMKKIGVSQLNTIKMLEGAEINQISSEKYQSVHQRSDIIGDFNFDKKTEWKNLYNEEKISLKGRIIGGNLESITKLIGTKYDNTINYIEKYKKDGIIWFLESFALNTADVYSALWVMKESGYFKYTSGFIFGKPAICENEYNISYEETLKDALGDLHVPVIYNADIGHVPPQLAIINGSIAEIISKDGKGIITCKKI